MTEFEQIYTTYIKREGSDKLLSYLKNSDFFTAPASARYHLAEEGGLHQHSVNVYRRLVRLVQLEYGENYQSVVSDETLAICGLLHDLCKINYYVTEMRNVKENGAWKSVPFFKVDEKFPYGHGEKSVYIISGFMRLTREEAFAIRYHMGFSGTEEPRNVGSAFEMFPLAFALSTADMEATYFLEGKN